MKALWARFVPPTLCALLGIPGLAGPVGAQYLFLDVNGDSVNTSTDTLDSLGIPTSVEVWIITDRNGDGSGASCATGPESLTINSYEVILHAVGGTVTYGELVNHQDESMSIAFGRAADSTDFHDGYGGATALPAGKYHLCTIMVTAETGNPSLQIAPSSQLGGHYLTSFGSHCIGQDLDNTLKLGQEWFDTGGLASPFAQNSPPVVTAPGLVSGPTGAEMVVEGGASDPEGGQMVLGAAGVPGFLTLESDSSGPGWALLRFSGIPAIVDVGTYELSWSAVDDGLPPMSTSAVTAVAVTTATTSLTISAPVEVTTAVGDQVTIDAVVQGAADPGNVILEALSLPAGASTSFTTSGSSARVSWLPLDTDTGTHHIRFKATENPDSSEAATVVTVVPASGWFAKRVSPGLAELANLPPGSAHPLIREIDGQEWVSVYVEASASNTSLAAHGALAQTRVGNVLTALCLRDSLLGLMRTPGVEAVIEPTLVTLHTDVSAAAAGLEGYRSLPPGLPVSGPNGAGVVIGIVDTGIDVMHPDFLKLDETTRLVGYWDQSSCAGQCPSSRPPGYTYGYEWKPSEDPAFLEHADTYSKDVLGHGTHVAGIAAGNARGGSECSATRFLGVAPSADLCVVKLKSSVTLGQGYPSSEIIDGVNYIFAKAQTLGKPAVVNLSLGSQFGPHDGTSYFDQLLSFYAQSAGTGKVIVASAGNDAQRELHGVAIADPEGKNGVLIAVPAHTPVPETDVVQLHGWFGREHAVSVTVKSPGGTYTMGPVAIGAQESFQTLAGNVEIWVGEVEPDFGDFTGVHPPLGVRVTITRPSGGIAAGNWEVKFEGDGQVDTYLTRSVIGNPLVQVRMLFESTADEAITSPASAEGVISVGGFVSKLCWKTPPQGVIACESAGDGVGYIVFESGHGPRRDGAMRPDLVAPGAMIGSCLSKDALIGSSVFDSTHLVLGGEYGVLQGTSFAAPHVTGAVALLLQDPAWAGSTTAQIRAHLQQTATKDENLMGALPNKVWGAGKLNVGAALGASAFGVQVLSPANSRAMRPRGVDSIRVIVKGQATDPSGVRLELVEGRWCSDAVSLERTLIGYTPPMAAGQTAQYTFVVPDSISADSVRVLATATSNGGASVRQDWSPAFLYLEPYTATGVPGPPEAPSMEFALTVASSIPGGHSFEFVLAVPGPGEVTLRYYSVAGRLVRERSVRAEGAGYLKASWDGRDSRGSSAPSGIYFLEARIGEQRLVRKLVLVR